MRIEIVKNFITQEECEKLNAWVDEAIEKKWLDYGITNYVERCYTRLTTRMYGNRFQYPNFILELSNKVRNFCNIQDKPLIINGGRDGIVVSCTLPGGDVYAHKDARLVEKGLSTLRCNIMSRDSEIGGKLFVDDQHIEIGCGDLHCYLASEHKHNVTKNEGNTSRIMWMFGAHINSEEWDSGLIQLNR